MSGKRFSSKKASKNGFYVALAICLVAVGIAAWSTYDAVNGYLGDKGGFSEVAAEASAKPSGAASSPGNQDDGEALKRRETQSALPKPAEETAGSTVESTPDAAKQPESTAESPAQEAPANTGVLYEISEVMALPVDTSKVLSVYSSGAPVYSKTMRDWRIHNGVDLKAEAGADVKACGNGEVLDFYTDSMLGNVAVVEHGEYVFYYCGLGEKLAVNVGDVVSLGQAIGQIAAVPCESAEEPHLHLEIKRDDVYVNPVELYTKLAG